MCLEIGFKHHAVRLDCNSKIAILLEKNPTYHSNTKNIDVQYNFVRDIPENQKVLMEKVENLKNNVVSLTKSVSTKKFTWC